MKSIGRFSMIQLKEKHPLAIRWFHWVSFPLLFLMIWSGVLIYWANGIYRIGWGRITLLRFFPSWFYDSEHPSAVGGRHGAPLLLHVVFCGKRRSLCLYLAFSGEWRDAYLIAGPFATLVLVTLHDLHLRKTPRPKVSTTGRNASPTRVSLSWRWAAWSPDSRSTNRCNCHGLPVC